MSTAEKWKNQDKIGEQVEMKGEEIFLKIQAKLKGLKPGTLVVINTNNEEYLVGSNQADLMKEFRAKFGYSDYGWFRKIGGGA